MNQKTNDRDKTYVVIGASNHSEKKRSENDFYATPPLATRKLLQLEEFSPTIYEPCCGMNHIANEFRKAGYVVETSDIVDMIGDGSVEIKDFLKNETMYDMDIVTNPPYKHAKEFVEKCLESVSNGHKVAMFLKLSFLEGKARKSMFAKYPPKTIYVSSERLGCSETGEFNEDGNTGSAIAYAWYIWEKGYVGDTILKWF